MSGRFTSYPEYRDTGVEWLTTVPKHWANSTLGFDCSVKARLGWKGLKAEEYVDSGYIFLATPNIKGEEIDFDDVNYITKERYDESPEIMLEEGDVLVTKDGSTTGTTALVRRLPAPATVNSSIAVLRSFGRLDSSYMFYFFTSEYTQNVITRMRGGMGVPHLFQADLRKFFVVAPPLEEQTQIAKFLDYETAKIDALIDKQQQLIALLKEKRQAVISHAVTKGLNPDAPMKDSGVEWLGEVPAHWTTVCLKYFSRVQGGYAFKSELFGQVGIPVVRIGDIGRAGQVAVKGCKRVSQDSAVGLGAFEVSPGDILMAMTGATIGKAGRVPEGEPALLNQRVGAFRLKGSALEHEFLWHVLATDAYQEHVWLTADGGAQPNISDTGMLNYRVVLPPIDEQKEVVEFLESRLPKLDALDAAAVAQIELLQERRTALISAAVTGKIDVRDWKAPEGDKEVA